MPRIVRGIPYVYEEFRDDYEFTVEKLVDHVDPPRFFPLIGPAQLHHCHWKCTVYYTETIESGYPFPFRCVRPRVQVVYLDLDHLHLCPGPSPDARPRGSCCDATQTNDKALVAMDILPAIPVTA